MDNAEAGIRLQKLTKRVRAYWKSLSRLERRHTRDSERVSFAYGNVVMGNSKIRRRHAERAVRRANAELIDQMEDYLACKPDCGLASKIIPAPCSCGLHALRRLVEAGHE